MLTIRLASFGKQESAISQPAVLLHLALGDVELGGVEPVEFPHVVLQVALRDALEQLEPRLQFLDGHVAIRRARPLQECQFLLGQRTLERLHLLQHDVAGQDVELRRELAGLGFVDDLFQRTGHEDVPHLGITLRLAGELVQDGEAAGDLVCLETPVLNRAGEVFAEAGVEEVVVVPNVETGFGEEVGEILLEILVDGMKTGSRVGVIRPRGFLHFSCPPPTGSGAPFLDVTTGSQPRNARER